MACTSRSGSRSNSVDRCIAAAALAATLTAHAQQAGDSIVAAGWVHVRAPRTSTEIHTDLRQSLAGDLLGVPRSFDSNDVSATLSKVDTLGLTFSHYVTDRWSLDFAGGIPAKVDVYGNGVVSPGGPLGQLFAVDLGDPEVNPLGSARQWSPALLAQYHFGSGGARFQPFVGVGFSYTWFTELRLNPAFEQRLNGTVGRQLALAAGKPGPTTTSIDTRSVWAPVVSAGLPWLLSERWVLIGSVAVAPFATRTQVEIHASDGTTLSTRVARVRVNALITGLLLGYRF